MTFQKASWQKMGPTTSGHVAVGPYTYLAQLIAFLKFNNFLYFLMEPVSFSFSLGLQRAVEV